MGGHSFSIPLTNFCDCEVAPNSLFTRLIFSCYIIGLYRQHCSSESATFPENTLPFEPYGEISVSAGEKIFTTAARVRDFFFVYMDLGLT